MNEWKKLISLNLALVMLVSLIQPIPVFAANDAESLSPNTEVAEPLAEEDSTAVDDAVMAATEGVTSGACGPNLTWALDDSLSTLTISGEGAMYDYGSKSTPWYDYRGTISKVIVAEGITTLCNYAFQFVAMPEVSLPSTLTSIGNYAFQGCQHLTSIVIPAGVTFIGSSAFESCINLASASVPGTVTSFGGGVFQNCHKLANVNLGEGLEEIPSGTFFNCRALISIDIPDSVLSIDNDAFSGCSALADVTFGSSVEEIGASAFYGCSMSTVALPDSVVNIYRKAFGSNNELTSVTIGSGVEYIASLAFAECPYLATVSIDNYEVLVEVAEDAFPATTAVSYRAATDDTVLQSWAASATIVASLYADKTLVLSGSGEMESYGRTSMPWYDWKENIEKVIIEDGITSVGDNVFYNHPNLVSVTMGSTIRSIGYASFSRCSSLASVVVNTLQILVACDDEWIDDESIVTWATGDDSTVANTWFVGEYDETDVTATLYTSGKLVISGKGWFKRGGWTNVTSVVVESGITNIPEGAFEACDQLTHVELGPDVFEIGYYAFGGCIALTSIEGLDNVTTIGAQAFYRCTALKSVTLSDEIAYIGRYAFYQSGLTRVDISGLNARIYDYAFSNCPALNSISVGGSLNYMGRQVFANCPKLSSVVWDTGYFNGLDSNSNLFLNSGKAGNGITLRPYGEIVPSYLFYTSSTYAGQEPYLTRITRNNKYSTYTEIGDFAFYRCIYLDSVTLSSSLRYIWDGAFNSCSALTELSLPSSLRSIGTKTFYLSGLSRLELGNAVSSIGENAFEKCAEDFTLYGFSGSYAESYAKANSIPFVPYPTSGTINGMTWSVDMDTSVLSISGIGLLQDASCPWENYLDQITEIHLSEGITGIGPDVFDNCSRVNAITFPASLTSLNNCAFDGCNSLKEVYFLGDVPTLLDIDGESTTRPFIHKEMTIYYKSSSVRWNICGWTNCTLVPFSTETGSLTVHDNNGYSDYNESISDHVGKLVNLSTYSAAAQERYFEFASSANLVSWNSASDGSGESYAVDGNVPIADDLHLYGQWETMTFTVDGNTYPLGTAVVGAGWSYDGDRTLNLDGYAAGSILLPIYFHLETSGTNTINGSIVAKSDLYLGIAGGSLNIQSADVAIEANNLTVDARGILRITSTASTAIVAADVFFTGTKPVLISAAEVAVSFAHLRTSRAIRVYLSEDAETEAAGYDGGSYLRLEAAVWHMTLHANGGIWNDQDEQTKVIEIPVYERLNLSSYLDLLSREGYVLDGWRDADDTVEYSTTDTVNAADLVLYAVWAEESLIVDGERYSPKSSGSGTGWSFAPADNDVAAVLTITDSYGGGHIYCTEPLIINITGSVEVIGVVGLPAIKVLGDLQMNAAGTITIRGGTGANGIEVRDTMTLYSEGEAVIYGGDGGAGIAADRTVLSSNDQLVIVGGLRAPAVMGGIDFSRHETGCITLIGGQDSPAVTDKYVGWNSKLKCYAGTNANTITRKSNAVYAHEYSYVRIQPKTITVVLVANGGTVDGTAIATAELAQDDSNAFTLKTDVTPALLGYSFEGWNTKSDGTGTSFVEGEVYTAEDSVDTVTLYAQWTAKDFEAEFSEDGTQVRISLPQDDLANTTLLLAAYSKDEQMLQGAYGVQEGEIWVFDIPQNTSAATWKLFYLDSNYAPKREVRLITFGN